MSNSIRAAARNKRERLFRKGKPYVRLFDPQKDMWILWAAYDLESFPDMPKGLKREEFEAMVSKIIAAHSSVLLVEDDCKYFKAKRGPVGLILVNNFGWRIEPYAEFFRWATSRMRLRCVVAFLQMTHWKSAVGVCVVRSPERWEKFFQKLRTYGVLFPCGKIPYGTPKGHEYLFYVRGKGALDKNEYEKAGAPEPELKAA